MTKAELRDLIKKHPSNFWKILKFSHSSIFDNINKMSGNTFSEKMFVFLNGLPNKCVCGNDNKFVGINHGYTKTCSRKCSSILGLESIQKKYGSNVSKLDFVKEKKKITFLKKYKVVCPLNIDSVRNKANDTLRLRYGGMPFQNKSIREKIQINKRKSFISRCEMGDRLGNSIAPLFDDKTFTSVTDRSLKFKCNTCGTIFRSHLMWASIPICKKCNPSSKFETEIRDFISTGLKFPIEINKFDIINGRELDIYIPSKKLAIECDGLYWHSEISGKKLPYYHIDKTNRCSKLGIRLIHIFEDEWIYKKDIVKNRLKSILGVSPSSIFARKCEIRKIDPKLKNKFLKEHHIQGIDSSSVQLGAFYNNELVSVMTFGKRRSCMGSSSSDINEYELYRFCSSCSVVGIASKLFQHFIKFYNPKKIISYCDLRWSDTKNIYEKLGFVKMKQTKCNYWYVIGNMRYHRYNFAKHILSKRLKIYDKNLSEWNNMKNNGYDRIWDCGSLKYEWKGI